VHALNDGGGVDVVAATQDADEVRVDLAHAQGPPTPRHPATSAVQLKQTARG